MKRRFIIDVFVPVSRNIFLNSLELKIKQVFLDLSENLFIVDGTFLKEIITTNIVNTESALTLLVIIIGITDPVFYGSFRPMLYILTFMRWCNS